MDSERWLFEKGCFLPSWSEDTEQPLQIQKPIETVSNLQDKDLNTLLAELEDIKKHIEDVRERKWQLAKLIEYHNNNFARE